MSNLNCGALLLLLALSFQAMLSAASAPIMRVRVYDRSGLPQSDLKQAVQELISIFRSADIPVQVQNCSDADACDEDLGVNEVSIRMPRMDGPVDLKRVELASDPKRLGLAFAGRAGTLATVYADRVGKAAERAGANADKVLGHVMAHEAAHLFGLVHSASGIMRAGWTDDDYRTMAEGRMFFMRAESRTIRARLRANSNAGSLIASAGRNSGR